MSRHPFTVQLECGMAYYWHTHGLTRVVGPVTTLVISDRQVAFFFENHGLAHLESQHGTSQIP
jgi:hypothetical protein